MLALANGYIDTGCWPKHFKEFTLVIIPKLNKPLYSTPKVFRPIVLLNTLGKLVEKMISNRFKFDMISSDLVDPNQMGGVSVLHRRCRHILNAPSAYEMGQETQNECYCI
jgi:hypothetical protein